MTASLVVRSGEVGWLPYVGVRPAAAMRASAATENEADDESGHRCHSENLPGVLS